ncbi:MAG: hypothetical protein A2928_02260 [Candidatus Taylorbacteria bacterium RIFCSPLOWO2_01_FULL_45_15b]|uniref:UDP-N-acetylmuramate--L-alanine ligase n=1 Tax=Candidatus Taylorbacteria bacterium RIFCSPLOWO2_01_FULL_45_15b TaxID=1802319 RepID=A0A1G2NCF5_9BACT|nr:MAG: hypothetical protein A2928_02260 [Candidatus Taylorbacteria bacterium RIFCSPLOWO2_01_FULL_45_15b]
MAGLQKAKKIFIAGIGGIGVSALARLFLSKGIEVVGSDSTVSPVTLDLERLGVKITYKQDVSVVPDDVDAICYSNAIPHYSADFFNGLKTLGKTMASYPESLADISRDLKTIGIAGTHGKTTTTAMVAKILADAKINPTVIVGSVLVEEKTNFVQGNGEYFLVEADEYKRAFLHLSPTIAVVTNIGLDHLDYYKDLADIQSAFKAFVEKVPTYGAVIADVKDSAVMAILKNVSGEVIDYTEMQLPDLHLRFPGKHNVSNAKAAAAVGRFLGVGAERIVKSLNNFRGTWRRFEFKGETARGAAIYDDYAHNPDKVRAAIAGAREIFPHKKIIAVFQPHLYSRTRHLFKEFATSFYDANQVIVAPIFAAREDPDPNITSDILAEAIDDTGVRAVCLPSLQAIRDVLETAENDSVIITIGAGDIYKVAEWLAARA